MENNSEIIAAIDIGTTKICAIVGQITENAFTKEYFDYYVKNMLGLTSDPDFEPEFAEKDQTLSYVDYLKTQVAFLNEVIGMIEGNRTGATNASENIQ